MAGDVVPSRASRKANGRLLQAVEAVGGHSLPQSKPHPSPRFPHNTCPRFVVTCDARHFYLTSFIRFAMILAWSRNPKNNPGSALRWFCALTSSTAFWRKPSSCSRGQTTSSISAWKAFLTRWTLPERIMTSPFCPSTTRSKEERFSPRRRSWPSSALFVPEVYDIDAQEQKFLMELVNKHEGRLTSEVFKGYRKLAQRMNMERIAHEKELKKLQGK